METFKLKIYGRKGQLLFFDEKDRRKMIDIFGYLPDHLSNDLRTYERCGRCTRIDFSTDQCIAECEAWDWIPQRIAQFVCLCYDSYFRMRYDRSGPQTLFEIMNKDSDKKQ